MEHRVDLEGLAKLREPFPDAQIGLLPKPYKKDSQKGNCRECGGYHGLPAAHLKYIGHAAITDRLRSADPTWTWEPLALDADGLPAVRVRNGTAAMWIRLTVCGVTRLGVGTAEANKAEVDKELISDALRNAAMRFGCGLDLWSKEGLDPDAETAPAETAPSSPPAQPKPQATDEPEPPMLQYIRAVGPKAPDDATITDRDGSAHNLKEFVRGKWAQIKENPTVMARVVAAIETATGVSYSSTLEE